MRAHRLIFDTQPWQILTAFRVGYYSWIVHIGVAVLTAAMLALTFPDESWPYVWAAGLILVCIAMGTQASFGLRIPETSGPELLRWGRVHTLLMTAAGGIWGVGALATSAGSPEILTLYSLAAGGAGLGAVSAQHPVLRSALAGIWSAIPLLALSHVLQDKDGTGLLVGIIVLLYVGTLSIVAVRMHLGLLANHELTTRLDAKVSELTAATAELDTARRVAEDANLAKSRFLAQASHDLRQPIHAISLLVTALRDSRLGRDQRQIVESIDRSVDSVIRLFGSLLDISRLEVGGVHPRQRPADLGAVLTRLGTQNAALAHRAGCELRVVPTRAWVTTDEVLLTTMLQNVVSNAIKHAAGASILVGVRRHHGQLSVEVHDTGPGIPEAYRDKVFDDYFRLEADGAAVEGMGLGLAIVRRLAGLMELSVSLSSRPGRGTSVSIGRLVPTSPGPRPAVVSRKAHPFAGKHIWLIDSDATVREATQRVLARWGCAVTSFALPPETLGPCDAILTNLQGGAAEMAILRTGTVAPIIVLTGHADPALPSPLPEDVILLQKPLRPADLRAAMSRLWAETP